MHDDDYRRMGRPRRMLPMMAGCMMLMLTLEGVHFLIWRKPGKIQKRLDDSQGAATDSSSWSAVAVQLA